MSEGKDPLHYVSEWYSVARYKQTYNGNITPIPDSNQWPHVPNVPTLIPPTMKRSVGRPSRNRKREEGEQKKGKRSKTVSCSICKTQGHNALKCKGGPTAKEVSQQQGKEPTKQGKKTAKKWQLPKQSDPAAMSLIEMMIGGTQFVDPSEAATSGTNPKTRKNKGKKKAEDNLIEEMMTGSQPNATQETQGEME